MMDVLGYFKEGLTQYRKMNWDKAIKAFNESLLLHKNDKLSQIYIERCEHLKGNPPGDEWNGVWVMKSK